MALLFVLALGVATGAAPAAAQIQSVDPNAAIDGDLDYPQSSAPQPSTIPPYPADPRPSGTISPGPAIDYGPTVDYGTTGDYGTGGEYGPVYSGVNDPAYADPVMAQQAPANTADQASAAVTQGDTYKQDDLIGAAEGVFGKGAEGLARMIEDILKRQGEPNGYIVGREGGGAFIFGARYGSGTLFHKIEGQRPVYWRGPSLGIDFGANAANTFVLVYNLFDTEDLFETYGAGEGQAYLIGGFHVSYLRRGNTVLIPVRMGAGLRLGVNVGYMKFSKRQRWMPF